MHEQCVPLILYFQETLPATWLWKFSWLEILTETMRGYFACFYSRSYFSPNGVFLRFYVNRRQTRNKEKNNWHISWEGSMFMSDNRPNICTLRKQISSISIKLIKKPFPFLDWTIIVIIIIAVEVKRQQNCPLACWTITLIQQIKLMSAYFD